MMGEYILYYNGKIVGVEDVDDKELLRDLLQAMYEELPAGKKWKYGHIWIRRSKRRKY